MASPSARPPYPAPRRTVAWSLRQLVGLLGVMLREYRQVWMVHVIFGMMMPLGIIFLIKSAGTGEITPERAIFLIGGNMATSIAYGPTMILIGKIGWGRHTRQFDYWSTLPLPKVALVTAMVGTAVILATPGLAGVYFLSHLMLGLPFAGGWAVAALVPLVALSLSGLGAFLGAMAKDGQTANAISNLFTIVVTFMAPTVIPLESLPTILQVTARVIPVTYAADALRGALAGNFGPAFVYNLLFLLFFTAGSLLLVQRKLDWRTD